MKVHIPTHLRRYTDGEAVVAAEGADLHELLAALEARHPGLRFRVVDEQDRIRTHIRFAVNAEVAKGLDHALAPSDEVRIIAALSGG